MAKPEQVTLNVLDTLSEHRGFHSSIFLTYGADLTFFENAILPALWDKGCRRNLIIMDAERYADTLNDLRGGINKIGQRYLVVPIRLGKFQVFHPKQILLLGAERARLLVGSGNLTFTGYGHNHEVFTCLDWTPDEPEWQYLCLQAWQIISTIMQRWGHVKEARTMIQRVEQLSPWLTHNHASDSPEIRLFHSLDEPLLQQIGLALGGAEIRKITILTPFLDEQAAAVNALYDYFHPKTVQLVLQDRYAVGNTTALENLLKSGKWLKIHHFRQTDDDQRYLHAKIYIFETANSIYVVTGSANCSQGALLSSSADGNVEIVFLRKGNSAGIANLLKNRINLQPVVNLEDMSLRSADIAPSGQSGEKVHLLDVSVESGKLVANFTVNSLPEMVDTLHLRVSTTSPEFIALGTASTGTHTIDVALADNLQKIMARPQSANIWGMDDSGNLVDLNCNELWITHVDILRFEMARVTPVDIGAGDSIITGVIGSENEWRELREALLKLVELDVNQLKRRKAGYSTEKSEKESDSGKNHEKETRVLLVDSSDENETTEQREIEEKNFKDSDFGRWFDYIRARLPGAGYEDSTEDDEDLEDDSDDVSNLDEQAGTTGDNGKNNKRAGHKWTPSEHEGRRFTNLVRKYIASLNNDEYMQIASIHQKISYYIVFQRIIWLLFEHKVIDMAGFVDFASQINMGLLGSPEEEPPALCLRLRLHIRSVWYHEWQTQEISAHILASLCIIDQFARQIGDDDLQSQVEQNSIWMLASLASIIGLPQLAQIPGPYSQLAELYHKDETELALQAEEFSRNSLTGINHVLDRWSQKAIIALENTKDPSQKQLLLEAGVDYGRVRYEILEQLKDIEEQTNLCSNLIFWIRFSGDEALAQQYETDLVKLLMIQGLDQVAAKSLFEQGKRLFLEGELQEAVAKLQRATVLARQSNDKILEKNCNQYLVWCSFRLDLQKRISM